MKNFPVFSIAFLLTFSSGIRSFGQDEAINRGLEAITEQVVKGQHIFLSSDWTEGRATGEKGGFMAADYIASIFQIYGLEPAGDDTWTRPTREQRWNGVDAEKYRTYFQDFSLIKYIAGKDHKFSLIETEDDSEDDLSSSWSTNYPFRYSNSYYEGDEELPTIQDYNLKLPGDSFKDDPVRIYLSKRGVNEILSGSGISIEQYEENVKNNMKGESVALEGKTAKAIKATGE